MGPAFALEDKSLADKKSAQVTVIDGEKAFPVGEQDLRHTEAHYDPE